MKPEAYIPEIICFGPYHNIDSCSAGSKIPIAEAYKGKSAAIVSQVLRKYGKSFDCIVEMMEQMLPQIGRFYDHALLEKDGEYYKNFAFTMAVDSTFLLLFLFGVHCLPQPASGESPGSPSLVDDVISFCRIYDASIRYDLLKLENQIPLFVLNGIFEKLKEAATGGHAPLHQHLNALLLERVLTDLTPFQRGVADNNHSKLFGDFERGIVDHSKLIGDAMAREPHLLGCIHAFVSPFLHIQTGGKDNGRARPAALQKCCDILEKLVIPICRFLPAIPYLKGMNAVQLARAGIKIKSFSKLSDKIRLDKYSATLYLPHIIISQVATEVFFRNMVALEFNDATRPRTVTRYVGVMGGLIQSPDDVRLLIDVRVICRASFALSDECTVKMWNDVRQPFIRTPIFAIPDELSEALREVLNKNYYKSKMKRILWGLFYYVSSWKFIAPFGVFMGLAMTAIQTYCSLYRCW